MSNRPTPRTDSAIMEIPSKFGSICVVRVELALDLERELGDALQERDELREEVASLRLEAKYYDEADALRKFREPERDDARAEWGKASMDAAQLLSEKTKVIAERDEAIAEIQRLRYDAQREAEHHDRMVKEIESLYDKLKS